MEKLLGGGLVVFLEKRGGGGVVGEEAGLHHGEDDVGFVFD